MQRVESLIHCFVCCHWVPFLPWTPRCHCEKFQEITRLWGWIFLISVNNSVFLHPVFRASFSLPIKLEAAGMVCIWRRRHSTFSYQELEYHGIREKWVLGWQIVNTKWWVLRAFTDHLYVAEWSFWSEEITIKSELRCKAGMTFWLQIGKATFLVLCTKLATSL